MEKEPFAQWAIIEIMGHQRLAGRATEEVIAGSAMLRVDVPPAAGNPAFTQYLGSSSIYRLTIVTEDVARASAAAYRVTPVSAFEIPALRQHSLEYETPEDFNDGAYSDDDDIPY